MSGPFFFLTARLLVLSFDATLWRARMSAFPEKNNDRSFRSALGNKNKMNAVSMKIATAIVGAAALQAAAASENLNANWAYVLDSQSDVVTSGYTGECVRTQWWTPALAA